MAVLARLAGRWGQGEEALPSQSARFCAASGRAASAAVAGTIRSALTEWKTTVISKGSPHKRGRKTLASRWLLRWPCLPASMAVKRRGFQGGVLWRLDLSPARRESLKLHARRRVAGPQCPPFLGEAEPPSPLCHRRCAPASGTEAAWPPGRPGKLTQAQSS